MKNFIKASLYFIIVLFILPGCKENKVKEIRKPKGGVIFGGALRISEVEAWQTLFPIAIADNISAEIANQIYEGLLKFNTKDLSVIPGLAEKWELDNSRTVYTFHLKRGAHFQDNDCFANGIGREVKAQDFKFSFELLCTQRKDNNSYPLIFKDILKGANRYYEASVDGKPAFGVEGIKVIDDYTLQLILDKPHYTFIYSLALPATVVIPKEAIEKYGIKSTVGSGPFVFASQDEASKSVVLVRNEKYHGQDKLGNQLPYLDSVIIKTFKTEQLAYDEFAKENIDLVYRLPAESIKEIVQQNIADFQSMNPKFILELSPQMSTQFYEFITQAGTFKDKRVRQAISYAIDRSRIVDNVLNGEAYMPGIYGVTPPVFSKYNNTHISGYNYDVAKAKVLLAEAGFPDGRGFPKITLELNSGGARNTNVALEVQKQLKENLNINMDLLLVPFARKINDEKNANGEFFRSSWIADYPNPSSFLQLLYGKTVPSKIEDPSVPNVSRYINTKFDELFEKGLAASSIEEGYKYFLQAEQIAMNDAPLLILWYDANYRLLNSKVKGLQNNPIQYRDFSETYISNSQK